MLKRSLKVRWRRLRWYPLALYVEGLEAHRTRASIVPLWINRRGTYGIVLMREDRPRKNIL